MLLSFLRIVPSVTVAWLNTRTVFDGFREPDPVADCQRDLLSFEQTPFQCLVEWQLLLDGISTT
jgi:hypothetical protein